MPKNMQTEKRVIHYNKKKDAKQRDKQDLSVSKQ